MELILLLLLVGLYLGTYLQPTPVPVHQWLPPPSRRELQPVFLREAGHLQAGTYNHTPHLRARPSDYR